MVEGAIGILVCLSCYIIQALVSLSLSAFLAPEDLIPHSRTLSSSTESRPFFTQRSFTVHILPSAPIDNSFRTASPSILSFRTRSTPQDIDLSKSTEAGNTNSVFRDPTVSRHALHKHNHPCLGSPHCTFFHLGIRALPSRIRILPSSIRILPSSSHGNRNRAILSHRNRNRAILSHWDRDRAILSHRNGNRAILSHWSHGHWHWHLPNCHRHSYCGYWL